MRFGDGVDEVDVPLTKLAILAVLVLGIIVVLSFIATGGDLVSYEFWAPKQARAENKVFHQTQQYTDGKAVHMIELCSNMAAADPGSPAARAFAGEIRVEASTIALNQLPPDVQDCVALAKGQ
jgi:hypothetical protein